MSTGKHLTTEIFSQILALRDAGHETKEISELLGVDLTTVRRWVMWRGEENSGATPVPRKSSGRPRKTSTRASVVIKRIMEFTPRINARKVKEENPNRCLSRPSRAFARHWCGATISFPPPPNPTANCCKIHIQQFAYLFRLVACIPQSKYLTNDLSS